MCAETPEKHWVAAVDQAPPRDIEGSRFADDPHATKSTLTVWHRLKTHYFIMTKVQLVAGSGRLDIPEPARAKISLPKEAMMKSPTPRRKAFTLIELLIVVAIIAILAAIAVPNFLEAQVRSKVSRVRSDLRTFATAIEAYTVDYNSPPPAAGESKFPALSFGGGPANQTGILTPAITTPVAYMTNFVLIDPFMDADTAAAMDTRLYTYQTYTYRWPKRYSGSSFAPRQDFFGIDFNEGNLLSGTRFKGFYGNWRMLSVGPDKKWGNDFDRPSVFSPANVGLPYDPSNGTISVGNIVRSQKEGDQKSHLNPALF